MPSSTPSPFPTARIYFKPGARGAPVTRWWTPRCVRSTRPATCTTACAWWLASFLVKDLHVDWRWGERYFAQQLNDYDLAANNGGWQWAASTGCDAQPYFRIFNPVTQSEKFDPEGTVHPAVRARAHVHSDASHSCTLVDERRRAEGLRRDDRSRLSGADRRPCASAADGVGVVWEDESEG